VTLSRIDIFYSDTLYLKREYLYHRVDTAMFIKIVDNNNIFKEDQIENINGGRLIKN